MDVIKIVGTQIVPAVHLECALRDLVEFIDGLTYDQLDHVPGLFDAARKARMALPADHIADGIRSKGK